MSGSLNEECYEHRSRTLINETQQSTTIPVKEGDIFSARKQNTAEVPVKTSTEEI